MIFFIVFIGLIVFAIFINLGEQKRKEKVKEYYKSIPENLPNFKVDKQYINKDAFCMIALCIEQKKIVLARVSNEFEIKQSGDRDFIPNRSLSFNQILKTEIIIDGETVSTKSGGGALTGALLFGVVGAVVGSNLTKTKTKQKIKKVSLKLILNDILDPSYELVFYQQGKSRQKVEIALNECETWQDTLIVAAQN